MYNIILHVNNMLHVCGSIDILYYSHVSILYISMVDPSAICPSSVCGSISYIAIIIIMVLNVRL